MTQSTSRILWRKLMSWMKPASLILMLGSLTIPVSAGDRPNILWITCEDMDPNLGCYGDPYAVTPNLDALAKKSIRFDSAFVTAPACSPTRSCLITGVWPNAMGTPHLRDRTVRIPEEIRPYPLWLREEGYYCANNVKEDYNYATPENIWDDSSNQAHWRGRSDPDQPFFSIFNLTITHQGQFREATMSQATREALSKLPDNMRHDPAKAPLPPYYPDTPTIRKDIATHYDCISAMDIQAGKLLDQLAADGLSDNTIVFFYSDHGRGMPRHKRWLTDGGLQVPLIIHFPEKWRKLAPNDQGTVNNQLISFLDFPPTLLSILGIQIPEYMTGIPFAGETVGPPRTTIQASRDRVDEVFETSRCVRDHRYKYIRNFAPHRPVMQISWYSELTPTRGELRRLATEGKLQGPEAILTQVTKPVEELYDIHSDPNEIRNLAKLPEYQPQLDVMRKELRNWVTETPDACLLPIAMMHRRAAARNQTVYEMARDPQAFPVESVFEMADRVGRGLEHLHALIQGLKASDPGVRYWAAVGLRVLGSPAKPAEEALKICLLDDYMDVRIAAADALCQFGDSGVPALVECLNHEDYWLQLHAAVVLNELGDLALPALPMMKQVSSTPDPKIYLGKLLARTVENLEVGKP